MDYYYKAVRPNGTDFYTGTIKYEVGLRVSHPTSKKRTKDDPSTYLSVSTVPTDCTGFGWPCRLFRVEGVGRAMKATDLPNKRAFLSVDVIEELPAHMVFGPQGQHVVALIERAGRLTRDEAKQLFVARDTTWPLARGAARVAARVAARGAARVAAGVAAWNAAWDAAWDAAWNAAGEIAWGAAWNAAGEIAWALVVRDLIGSSGFTQAHYDTLTGPWRTAIGPVHPDDEPLEGSK
jgi:hypothetical protein